MMMMLVVVVVVVVVMKTRTICIFVLRTWNYTGAATSEKYLHCISTTVLGAAVFILVFISLPPSQLRLRTCQWVAMSPSGLNQIVCWRLPNGSQVDYQTFECAPLASRSLQLPIDAKWTWKSLEEFSMVPHETSDQVSPTSALSIKCRIWLSGLRLQVLQLDMNSKCFFMHFFDVHLLIGKHAQENCLPLTDPCTTSSPQSAEE